MKPALAGSLLLALACGCSDEPKQEVWVVKPGTEAEAKAPAAPSTSAEPLPEGRAGDVPSAAKMKADSPLAQEAPAAAATPKPVEPAAAKPSRPSIAVGEPNPSAPPAPEPKPATAAEPAKPAEPAPAAKTRVRVPQSAHVKVIVPAELQALLDDDPRMQPWLDTTLATINACQQKTPGASGNIDVALTMHENARPSTELGSVPAALTPIFTCAMNELMRAKRMPLFTGPEGQRHSLRVTFVK